MVLGERNEETGDTLVQNAAGANGSGDLDNQDEVQAQVGDGTSPSGAAEHGGPISGRIEGESDPDADSSATKQDTDAGGNPFMGTDTEEAAPALDVQEPVADEMPAEEASPALDADAPPVADEVAAEEALPALEADAPAVEAPTAFEADMSTAEEMPAVDMTADAGSIEAEVPEAAQEDTTPAPEAEQP